MALVSGSSDLTVKVWRPHSEEDSSRAVVIGEHSDYVKCVATPPTDMNANMVASGGLDRKICLWDLNGAGKTLEIDVRGEEIPEKGSVYALAVGPNIVANGGPEKTIRIYDTRTGDKISKLVGHLDIIRSILIDDSGDIILSASADKTIKMWSVRGGRCMYTFTMHEASVWSLFSDHPDLAIFYSADRDGLVTKTDVRGSMDDLDCGLNIALAQEHCGVVRLVAAGGSVWAATNRSSINRWGDIDMSSDMILPEGLRQHRATLVRPQVSSPHDGEAAKRIEIRPESILRISNTALFPPRAPLDPDLHPKIEALTKLETEATAQTSDQEVKPFYEAPQDTIEGHFGLLKHRILNDRRRVLTLDTAGDVLLWDLLEVCVASVLRNCPSSFRTYWLCLTDHTFSANRCGALESSTWKMWRRWSTNGRLLRPGVQSI